MVARQNIQDVRSNLWTTVQPWYCNSTRTSQNSPMFDKKLGGVRGFVEHQ